MRLRNQKSKLITFLIFIFPGMRLLFYLSLFIVFFITPVDKITSLPLCGLYYVLNIIKWRDIPLVYLFTLFKHF